jgi:hypothetical protein
MAGIAAGTPPGEGGFFDPPEGGVAAPWPRSRWPRGVPRGLILGRADPLPSRQTAGSKCSSQFLSQKTGISHAPLKRVSLIARAP